jgi:hypothetical protein
MAKEVNPRLVFERLFASETRDEVKASREKRDRYKLSVLDFVMEDAGQLKTRLGASDQRKLDEYLSAVRELETRIARTGPPVEIGNAKLERPVGIPIDYQEHIRLMGDILTAATAATNPSASPTATTICRTTAATPRSWPSSSRSTVSTSRKWPICWSG